MPASSIARKKDLLFADDFAGAEPAKAWHKVVATFAVENGLLKGIQTRDRDVLAADGKVAVRAHAAVHGLNVPARDNIVEVTDHLQNVQSLQVRRSVFVPGGQLFRSQLITI